MTQKVKSQILKVRDTAETNMFDINGVMQIANRLNLFELVVYLAERENHKEYSHFIMTGTATFEDEPVDAKIRTFDLDEKTIKANEDRINALFEELVPMSGKSETVAGEIIRAVSRIGYRYYNDGDHIGVGYGKETCNPAARYLLLHDDEAIENAVHDMWGVYDDDDYHERLSVLEAAVLAFLDSHPGLMTESNDFDIWDFRDDAEDVDDEDDYED